MKDKIVCKTVYVFCPAKTKTGGPELLHQLVFMLNKYGKDAKIVYFGQIDHSYKIIEEYTDYIDSYLLPDEIEDLPENLVIVPEVNVFLLKKFKNVQKAIWWLSVDNFYFNYLSIYGLKYQIFKYGFFNTFKMILRNSKPKLSLKSKFMKTVEFHLCQSEYAMIECKKFGLKPIYLSDYLNSQFFKDKVNPIQKENIVAYSPAKGFNFTKKIIKKNPDIKFVPIQNMSRDEVQHLLEQSKVYIDFGNHPGMDRIPREARMQGCVIITGKNGSAKYYRDVPIEEKFERRIKNIKKISNLIKNIFENYDFYNKKQVNYTNFIQRQEQDFENDVLKIFKNSFEN